MLLKLIHALTGFLTRLGKKRTIPDRENKSVYLGRYYLFWGDENGDRHRPNWLPINIMLHHLCRSDENELHDHPWWNCSLILTGGYWETTPKGKFWRSPGTILFRRAIAQHRLEIDPTNNQGGSVKGDFSQEMVGFNGRSISLGSKPILRISNEKRKLPVQVT